jgi:hypothetical protein
MWRARHTGLGGYCSAGGRDVLLDREGGLGQDDRVDTNSC